MSKKVEGLSGLVDATDSRPLDSYLGFLLFRAGREVTAKVESVIAELGLSVRHNGVLMLLEVQPLSQVTLCERLRVDRTTMVTIIDELEAFGYATRVRNPHDRRAHLVTITSAGLAVIRQAHFHISEAEERIFAAFSLAEREQLRQFLRRLL